MNSRIRRHTWIGAGVVFCVLWSAGCTLIENPWRDDLPAISQVSTASAQAIHAEWRTATPRHRDWPAAIMATQDQGVDHSPLYWSDPFEDHGSDDLHFAWTWEDYLALPGCPARQMVNTAALPISVVVDPIWAVRCSDGRISPQTFGFWNHDPVVCGGVAIPPDLVEAYYDTHTRSPVDGKSGAGDTAGCCKAE